MSQAIESPLLSLLLTQGRHRNASVILLLQNMFPKGKFNTNISRNAQYMVLFRSPSDRKQIGIIAERMFDKNRTTFMSAYTKETEKPHGYLLVDNQPKTTSDNQVVADIFGECRCYPNIVTQDKSVPTLKTDPSIEKPTVQTKLTTSKAKQQVTVKSSVKTKPVKVKQTVEAKPPNVKQPVKVKNSVKVKEATRKQAIKRKRMSEDPSVEITSHLNSQSFGPE